MHDIGTLCDAIVQKCHSERSEESDRETRHLVVLALLAPLLLVPSVPCKLGAVSYRHA